MKVFVKGTSKNQDFFVRARKPRAENRNVWAIHEDLSTRLTPPSRKRTVFRSAQKSGLKYVVMGVLLTCVSCAIADPPVVKITPSLYDRLGGKPAIVAVIDEFVGNVAKDNRLNARFATTNIPRLKGHLVDQVCSATGGPCAYSGRDMITTHRGMGITNAEFSALVANLGAALETFNVPKVEQTELLGLLGPMKSDIVENP